MRKKLTFLLIAILASLGAMASPPHQDEGNVAKVGSTEYATIEEAVAAWGPGKTLTLLSDVTTTSTVTVEVNATKSTQNWILELGDYTWTANGCNAFQLYAAGGTVMNQNYGLKVSANQNGGITASGKYCIECKYDNSKTRYRPRLEIHGGTYNANYVVFYQSLLWNNTNIENGPSTHFFNSSDGTEPIFNGNFALAKCPITVNAGYFNGTSFNTYPVGSTADTNLKGGHFKTINSFPSANNNKGIIFGNYKVFFKSDASIDVVNGAPTEYEAKATKTLHLSSNQSIKYTDYVYYEKADDAIKKYASGNIEVILSNNVTASENKSYTYGTLTIDASAEGSAYTGNITLNGANAKFIVKFPEGGGHYGVSAKSPGRIHVEETVADGIVTRTYSYLGTVANPEAKIGDTGYSTVYDAFYAVDGTTDNKVIVLQKDVTNAGIVTNGTATGGDGKTVATFDLNGKSIGIGSVAAGNNADYTLTIIDSSEEKTGTVTNSDASLFILALTGINDYSGSYKLKIQAGTWQFNPSAVVIKGETHDLVDEGYVARDNGDGTWTVGELPYVAQYKENKYRTLQAALDAAKDVDDLNIVIDLLDDVTLDITAWDGTKNELSIGTANTQSITINGNNHKLDFVNKNSDWNNVATMNDAQTKLILNNMTITNSGYNNGPWNRHDINFNCAVELNNVTSDKALAFKNSATLKNVTITETRVVDDGDYCIWISPRVENQTITIDGLIATATNTNKNGRGIKVDAQYVDNPPRVTLNIANSTFTTDKKAAILLKSAGGVDVIDGGNNNIENVAADKVNLVWVDEDKAEEFYKYSLTSSTGATMVPESKESDYVARLSDAEGKILGYYKGTNAIANAVGKAATGYTVTIFKAGSYTMPDLPNNITVEAAENVDGVVFNHTASGNVASVSNGATFKNLTFNFGNNDYHGFQHAGTINMEGCTLNGKLFSYGAMNFTKCVFNQSAEIAPKGDYNMWTYGVNDVKYTECTFKNTKTGKFLNVYREGDGYSKVYVDKCKFINEGSVSKAALNVKATCGSTLLTYDVYITESTIEGAFPAASISSELVVLNELVQVDDRTATGVDNIRVWKDDVQIYPLKPVAKIGEIGYPTLQSAVDAAYKMTGDVTIQLVDNITEYAIVLQKAGLNLTIDGKDGETNHTIKGQIIIDGMGLDGAETLTITNVEFEAGNILAGTDAFILVPNPKDANKPWTNTTPSHNNHAHNITISNCSFTGEEGTNALVAVKTNSGTDGSKNLTFNNNTAANLHSFAQLTAVTGMTFNGNEVTAAGSFVNISGGNEADAVFANNKFTSAKLKNDNYAVRVKGSSGAKVTLTDNEFEAPYIVEYGDGSRLTKDLSIESGIYVGDIIFDAKEGTTGKIVISGGHFSAPIYEDAYSAFIADGLTGINGLYADVTPQAPHGIGEAVAQVDDVKFGTFSAAVTAAAGTKVIVLLKDIADTYAMTAGETLKVQKDGKAFNDPTAPADFTLKTLIDGAVTIYSVKANENLASISEGYYHIKNLGNDKYVNVKGRRTATVDATADDANTAAGTIIKVKATNGQVEVLRSQAIDIPHYADRAMSYVHDFAKLLVEKLNASGSGEILGTTGYEAIMKKFDDSFDHHLYVEQAQDGYRIFGRTPSMKPVVEFYQENKAKVDAKLPMLEQKINDAIAKVVDKVGKGSSLIGSFELHTIWKRMNNSALTEPNDDATKLAFLQEVLSSEINVWNFAYESATFYMEKVEGSQYFEQIPAEIRNYWNLAKQVHPDFKYYIVQKDGKMDFISEGNTDIIKNDPRTVWALEKVDKMTVSVPEENSRVVGATFDEAGKRTGFETAYYTTLYTDFGYQLPEGVTALKVTKIKDTYLVKQKPENKLTYESDGVTLGLGLLETKEIGQDVPAQTPVLIMSKSAKPFQITIGDSYGASADVTDNLLHGADWLINEYKINTPALENLFALVEGKVSESITDKYEHLLRRNSGTVNNKYFFPISVKEDLAPAYKNKTGYKMQISPVLVLGKKEGKKLAFNETKDVIQANSVFLFSEENKPALFTLTGDVTRDGIIDVEDVTGQVNIVQKRDKKDYKYDYDAADVVVGKTYYVDVDDVTRVLNIIQKRTDHPDLP